MLDFKIDQRLCTQCGLCSKECPTLIINGKNGIPEIKEGKEKNCIKCQHCMAVCPTGALSIFGKKPEDSLLVAGEGIDAELLAKHIKTRRSVRKFKQEELPEKLVQQLLETAAYAPTGHNKNQVLLSVVDNKEDLKKVRTLVYDAIKEAKESKTLSSEMAFMGDIQSLWESKGVDVLFRDAPHMIIASGPKSIASSVADSVIALSYFELLANAMGIGTLWDGLAKFVFDHISSELQLQLGIPEDHVIGYMMVFGKPAVKYARAVQSDGLNLNKISL